MNQDKKAITSASLPAPGAAKNGWVRLFLWQAARPFRIGTIRSRLLLAFTLVVLLAGIITTGISAFLNFQSAQQKIINQLELAVALKATQVDDWLQNLEFDLEFEMERDRETRLILTLLRAKPGAAEFQISYANQLRRFQQAIELRGVFEELFVLDSQGRVVISTDAIQEEKILNNQTYFQEGLKGVYIQPPLYSVSLGRASVIAARPVVDSQGQVLGVLAGRASPDKLNEIMVERTGLGETGETYLVASNQSLLTESRFIEDAVGKLYVRTEGVQKALIERATGSGLYPDYREVPVVGVYRWLPRLQAVLLAEQDQAEAFNTAYTTLGVTIAVSIGAILFALLVGLWVTRSIAGPLASLAGVAQQIAAGNLKLAASVERTDEIGELAQAFNSMTAQLRGLIDNLEERIQERTRALETSAEISRQITTIPERDKLLQYVVERIQTEFKFYHTHIYLVDNETSDLVMVEGSGNVGWQLKEQGHRLKMGQGIVGGVAKTNESFLANNVNEVSDFFRNALLPNTNAELAVPLRKGTQVMGVLDIQSEQIGRFTPQDVSLMQSIADQTAVVLDNTRLLTETQTALREVERLNRRLTREVWEQFGQEVTTAGYRFISGDRTVIEPDSTAWLPPMKQAAAKKQLVKQNSPGNGNSHKAELAVPLILRGEVIGVLGVKREERPDWAKEEVDAVEAVADQVARALENARLSKEQEKTIEQLKEIDRLKSEFLTSMSHELRTPLNSIIGFADVLLQGIDGDLPDLALNDIKLIHNSGQHLLALINDILDLSKIEAGKMELVREPLNIRDTVRDVLAASNSLVKNKPVEIRVDLPPVELPPVYADKLRLNQILINLVSNAAKFTHEGSITIKAEVQMSAPDRMRIAIIDTGIGIPRNKLETIFDRFRQADSSTTRKYGGTGLGLAISRNLVQMHGGDLRVMSEEGVGSEFYFTIPLANVENLSV